MEIITYWNGEELSYVLNAIASLLNSLDFNSILKIVAYSSVIIVFLMGVTGIMKQEDWPKYVGVMVLSIFVMTGPRETVTITDRSVTMPATVVGGVPMPLAWMASTTSGIGSSLTTAVETVFQILPPLWSGNAPYPPEISFTGGGGPLFGHRIIEESGMLSINSPILGQDMMSFYRECVIPDINTGYINVNDLSQSQNIWSMFNDTNPARYVTIHYYDSGTGKWMWDNTASTCPQVYLRLTNYLTNEATTVLHQLGRRMNYKSNQAAAESLIVGQLQAGYGAMLGISANAVDIVQQKMMTNFIRDAAYKIPAMSGDASGTQIGLAQAQAEAQYASSSLTMRKVAEGILPKVRNVLEALIYALFPILVIYVIAAGNNALKPLGMYFKLVVWIQLWPMLYAILNFFITFGSAKAWQAETLGNGLAMQYSALVNAGAASDMAVAGMMVMSIPAIAWMLASGAVYAATQVATGMMQPASAAASSAGSQAAMGNNSMGNVSLRNANADKFDMSPNISSGTMSMMGSSGREYGVAFGSGAGLGANTSLNDGFRMNNLSTDVSTAFQKVQQASQNYEKAHSAVMSLKSGFSSNVGSDYSASWGFSTEAGTGTAIKNGMSTSEKQAFDTRNSDMQSAARELSQATGRSEQESKSLLANAGFGTNAFSFPALKADLTASYNANGQSTQKLDEAMKNGLGDKLEHSSSHAYDAAKGINWDKLANSGDKGTRSYASSMKKAMDYSKGIEAAEQTQETAKTALSDARSEAATATYKSNEGHTSLDAQADAVMRQAGDAAGKGLTGSAKNSAILAARENALRNWSANMLQNGQMTQEERNQMLGNTIQLRANSNNETVTAAGSGATGLANTVQGQAQTAMAASEKQMNENYDQLLKDTKGVEDKVAGMEKKTGQKLNQGQKDALLKAEAAGLISYNKDTGEYQFTNPDTGKQIDKGAEALSKSLGGIVSADTLKTVGGLVGGGAVGAGVKVGTAVAAAKAATEAAKVAQKAQGAISTAMSKVKGAESKLKSLSPNTSADDVKLAQKELSDARTAYLKTYENNAPKIGDAKVADALAKQKEQEVTGWGLAGAGAAGGAMLANDALKTPNGPTTGNIDKKPDGYSDAGGSTLTDAGNNKPIVTNNSKLAPIDGKRINSISDSLASMLGSSTTGNKPAAGSEQAPQAGTAAGTAAGAGNSGSAASTEVRTVETQTQVVTEKTNTVQIKGNSGNAAPSKAAAAKPEKQSVKGDKPEVS